MFIVKCDLCSKETTEEVIHIRRNFFSKHLCEKCAAPIIKFLIKNDLDKKA